MSFAFTRFLSTRLICAGCACLGLAPLAAAQTPATVTVTVHDVAIDKGTLHGQLCSDPGTFAQSCQGIDATAPAKKGDVVMVFKGVAPGTYGLSIYHDEDSDGRLNVFAEPFAFGNDSRGLPPAFEPSSFKVAGDMKTETSLFRMTQ